MNRKTRRRFSDEFKTDAVKLVTDQGCSVSEAARRLGVERSILGRWCRKHRQQISEERDPSANDYDAELKKLREENRKLRIEKEILKKDSDLLRERAELRFLFIESEKATYPIAILCQVMQVSRSGFYAWQQRGPDEYRLALCREVKDIHKCKRGSYGSRRMAMELRRRGYDVGRYQARSLMREAGVTVEASLKSDH